MQNITNEDLIQKEVESESPFEEIIESKEMIEEKIFIIKSRMIDFTVR